MDDQANAPLTSSEAAGDSGDWIDASEALRLVRKSRSETEAHQALSARAASGLLRASAKLFEVGDVSGKDVPVPQQFWSQGFMTADWVMGDFSVYRHNGTARAFGVRFSQKDFDENFPGARLEASQPPPATSPSPSARGRPMSELWPDWVAEVVAHVHEKGYPAGIDTQGQNPLIDAVADGLAKRELEAPPRSTVLDAVKAILRRGRDAEK